MAMQVLVIFFLVSLEVDIIGDNVISTKDVPSTSNAL